MGGLRGVRKRRGAFARSYGGVRGRGRDGRVEGGQKEEGSVR